MPDTPEALAAFFPAARSWFARAFEAPTPAQVGAWRAINAGESALVVAPTGSGKTLAAFFSALDRLAASSERPPKARRTTVLYVSPLKALAVDVERNLRAPLTGIRQEAARLGLEVPEITVGLRSGDTPADQRRRLVSTPPDILITTPESLYLMLTSAARESLRSVATVIVDEVHAVAGTKRGAHLALSLERLDALLDQPAQRIGLSATVRPAAEVARFLGGARPVTVVDAPSDKAFDIRVEVPVADMAELGAPVQAFEGSAVLGSAASEAPRASIWPHVEERVVDLISEHTSTLVFVNSRRLSERLTSRLNEVSAQRLLAVDPEAVPTPIARAHHGSVSKEQRATIEEDLKAGRLPAVVATSSLELGIDMGAVDLVVQVEAPPTVAAGLQRIGRAGHQVGAVSRGTFFPKYRGDLVAATVVAGLMRERRIEELRVPENPLDVLAQQIVAAVSMDPWPVAELLDLVRRAAPYRSLPESAWAATLDMLAGRYPSDEFAELRPRIVWDRTADTLTARPGAQRLAVTSGGTIPDRGLFAVHLVGERSPKVGELDEEMVYESRVGDVFALGASSWRIEDITGDRVIVSPAPGQPGKMPFWHGDALGRGLELGRSIGAFVREVAGAEPPAASARLAAAGLDELAASNLLAYLTEQRQATGRLPDDRTVVLERFRDELGDWQVVIHSPFGAAVHAPWALAIGSRLRMATGMDVQVMHADDGIVLRIPDVDDETLADEVRDALLIDADEISSLVTSEIGGSALFAARFRECAARALLLPRRDPKRRAPLWQQRQRSAQLLSVASQYPSFPILLETVRECVQDVYDVPGLREVLGGLATGQLRLHEVVSDQPSPFARSLLFGYVAAFMYEGDSPLAERRAQALTLDPALLAELLGTVELRELLDAEALAEVAAEAGWLHRKLRDAEDLADALRVLGPLDDEAIRARGGEPAWAQQLVDSRRAIVVAIAGRPEVAAIEDAGRLRDALGTALPVGVPLAFTEPVADPLGEMLARYARTNGPFTTDQAAARFGLGAAVARSALEALATRGKVVSGEFTPGASGSEWCDAEVLRRIRRRSIAVLRQQAEPVPARAYADFLPTWHGVGGGERGIDGVMRTVERLAGTPVTAGALETLILPSRVRDYSPGMLDELTATGEVVWCGAGALPGGDGWLVLAPSDALELLPQPQEIGGVAQLVVGGPARGFAQSGGDGESGAQSGGGARCGAAPLTVGTAGSGAQSGAGDEARPAAGNGSVQAASSVAQAVLAALSDGGGWFYQQVLDRVAAEHPGDFDPTALPAVVTDLMWSGWLTNDTLAPVRQALGGRTGKRPAARPVRRRSHRRASAVRGLRQRPGPVLPGRWSTVPRLDLDPTRRAAAIAPWLLERHAVLTRGAMSVERYPGGFAAAYKVLSALEDGGSCIRAYAVEGLGAAQFTTAAVVDRLRAAADSRTEATTVVLAATDPAQPYGAALGWPARREGDSGHRPGRKAGAAVILHGGELVLYLEKGGRTMLTFSDDPPSLTAAATALAQAVRDGRVPPLAVRRSDGDDVLRSPAADALAAAGFALTPRGLRMRAG